MHIKVLTFFSVLVGALLAGLVYSTGLIHFTEFFLLFVGFSVVVAFLLIYMERVEQKGLPPKPKLPEEEEEQEEPDATFEAGEEAAEDEDLKDDPELDLGEDEPAPAKSIPKKK